ncbi:MAG TPA: bifunctional 5,10-methylenetetrahydrofolate dehydrogenase/5,10-methenyltetrahydrofolate cyclohydrolase [Candidatus Binataceae bacterium]|nr:bifunctional 5,10-methylenetetrahydrofolate dehydrogenase/5,10-methenyltetrahydrofolate cyclohydrolase [Candidatus Binataceae bacterium]
MSATIMDGREVSRRLRPELERYASELKERSRRAPALAAVLVGDDPASRQYVRNKRRFAEELGFESRIVTMTGEEAATERLLEEIARLNADPSVAGILLQLPLPDKVDPFRLFDAIDPAKDVDAVGAVNVSDFYRAQLGRFIPCTPRGVLTLLNYYGVPVDGARAAVIGRSDIAGKPMALILGGRMCNATVTWCHRHTRDLAVICREADIVVSCAGADTGRPFLITADMVKPGACVIDVGFRRVGPGKFVGDVDFDQVKEVAGWLTLNPGGTGPMTVLALMQNLIDAARYSLGLKRAAYSIDSAMISSA